MSKARSAKATSTQAKSGGVKVAPRKAASVPPEPTHKQRFEQLLDDVVLGVPPKR